MSADSSSTDAETLHSAYASPTADTESLVNAEVVAEPVIIEAPVPPRIWTALVAATLAIPVAIVLSIMVLVTVMVIDLGLPQMINQSNVEAWFTSFTKTRIGLLVFVLPGQIAFLGIGLGAAYFSPHRLPERLRLSEGDLPMWTWPIFAIGTPVIGMVTSILMSFVFTDLGEHMELLQNLFRSHRGLFTLVVVATVALLPGFSEELLFRGYVQSRLLQRLPPAVAIGFSSLLFAVAHLDPIHVLAVFPLGVWLGILAWRANSIWPAVLCHAVNNSVAIMMTQASDDNGFDHDWDLPTCALLAVSLAAMILSCWLLRRTKSHA